MATNILWFRRDLRLEDNEVVTNAEVISGILRRDNATATPAKPRSNARGENGVTLVASTARRNCYASFGTARSESDRGVGGR